MSNIRVFDMTKNEISAVSAISSECFSMPWSYDGIEAELSVSGAKTLVAEVDGEIAGFLNVRFVLDECSINNIAVTEKSRRKGVAKALLTELLSYSKENRIEFVNLEVRASNEKAKSLYKGFGFKTVGIRRNFYEKPVEDAYIMVLMIKKDEEEEK